MFYKYNISHHVVLNPASSMHQRRCKKVDPAMMSKVWQDAKYTGKHTKLACQCLQTRAGSTSS